MTIFLALNDLRESATRKYELFCEKIRKLEEKAKTIQVRENELESISVPVDPAKLNDVLLLNFGGEHIDIVRSSLLLYPVRNGLITLLSGNYDHLLPKDKNGRIFFDIDKRVVEPLFNYCRDLAMWNGEESTKPAHVLLKDKRFLSEEKMVGEYFQAVPSCVHSGHQKKQQLITKDSLILSELQSFDERALFDMFPNENQFSSATLLYRGSRDGFGAKDFHDKCDGKPNTVVIIRDTEGNVSGGYASVPWASPQGFVDVPDSSAFLFTLAVDSKVNVVQHKPLPGVTAAVGYSSDYMCAFLSEGASNCDLLLSDHCSSGKFSGGKLGGGFNAIGNIIPRWTVNSIAAFVVEEIEVFQLNRDDVSSPKFVCGTGSDRICQRKIVSTDNDSDDETLNRYAQIIRKQEVKLQDEAEALIAELQFVAKHCGVTLPPRSEPVTTTDGDNDDSDEIYQFASALAYIRELNAVLQSADVTVGCKVVDTVTINAGGRLVTTAKATLQQAPEGSILANMTSDVWGHGLDRDGNIYQDVNSELFVTIINHLRLKRMLHVTNIQVPPIAVYKEQKTALDNLLSFYMLTDLPVSLSRISWCD